MKKSIVIFSVLLLSLRCAWADTPPARTINSLTYDASSNPIESSVDTGVRGLNVHVTNSTSGSSTANQGTPAVTANAWPTYLCDAGGVHCLVINVDGSLNVVTTISGSVSVSNAFALESTQQTVLTKIGNIDAHTIKSDTDHVLVTSSVLPSGAATSALQTTINTTLGSPFQAGGTIGNSSFGISGTLPAFGSTPTFNLGTLNGAATSAKQDTIIAALGSPFQVGGSIGNTTFASTQSGNWSTRTQDGSGNALTSQVNGSQRALDVGVNVSGVQVDPRSIRALTSSDVVTVVQPTGTSLHSVVDSGSITANAGTNLNTSALALDATLSSLSSKFGTLGQKTMAGSAPVVIASDQASIPVSATLVANGAVNVAQFGGTNVVTGTGTSGSGIPRVTVSSDSSLSCNAGTNLNTSALATSANQTNATQKTQLVDGSGNVVGPVTTISAVNYMPVMLAASGTDGSTAPSRTVSVGGLDVSGNLQSFRTDVSGNLYNNNQDGSGNAVTSTAEPNTAKRGLSTYAAGADSFVVGPNTANAVNNDIIPATDVSSFGCLSVQSTVSGTNTVTFQGSNDNFTTTTSMECTNLVGISNTYTPTITATGMYYCPLYTKYFRARMTAFTSGSNIATSALMIHPCPNDYSQKPVTNTQSGTANVSISQPGLTTDIVSGTIVATTTGGNLTPGSNIDSWQFIYNVTAENAATTTDAVLQESLDTATTYRDVWHFERVTGAVTPQLITPRMRMHGNRFRLVETLAGSTKSITRSLTHIGYVGQGQEQRRFFDRTIDLNSTATPSAVYAVDGCAHFNFTVNMSACSGTFPTLALAVGDDSSNLATTPYTIVTTTNGTFTAPQSDYVGKFAQIKTTSAGASCTLGYVSLSCKGD